MLTEQLGCDSSVVIVQQLLITRDLFRDFDYLGPRHGIQ
jgi:hypothetical protein